MVVLAARCFRLFLSNAGTRAVCQKLTYETDKFHNFAQLPKGAHYINTSKLFLHLLERDGELEEFGQGLGEGG